MSIANNFITERNNSEVIAVGLNSIREICARCPLAMNEDLLGDLIQYRNYRDKAVSYAAKSLIQLFREKNPNLLQKKLRGKPTEEMAVEGARVRQYGEVYAKPFIPGAEVIAVDELKKAKQLEDENEWEEIDADSDIDEEKKMDAITNKTKKRKLSDDDEDEDDEDSEGEWVDVSSGEDDEEELDNKEEENIETKKLTLQEKEDFAMKVSTEKILTQEEFRKIRLEQLKKKVTDKGYLKGAKKRKVLNIDTDSEDDEENKAKRFVLIEISKICNLNYYVLKFSSDGLVPLSKITSINKKTKEDKEARLARVMVRFLPLYIFKIY
jgi:protein SDA1